MKVTALALVLCLTLLPLLAATTEVEPKPKPLLLFGNTDHKTFLGCINCAKTSPLSVCNRNSIYGWGLGWKPESIWYRDGTFGNQFNLESPWNALTESAPVIMDREGHSYGYFSVNKWHHDRTQIKEVLDVLDFYREGGGNLDETRKKMCGEE